MSDKKLEPHCPWCGARFASWPLAKPHVKHCSEAPHKRVTHAVRMTVKKNRRQGRLFE